MSFQPSSSQGETATEKHESDTQIGPGAVIPVAVLAPPIQQNGSDALLQKAGSEAEADMKKAAARRAPSAIKPFIGPIVVAVAVIIGVAFVWNRLTSLRSHHQQQVVGVHGSPAPERPRFSLSHFAQLRDGMTYAEVCKILGDNGVDRLRSNSGGVSAKFVGWENSDGSFIQVGFHDDKATTLLQVGLK